MSSIKIKAPEPLKFSLLKAAINCEHHITGSVIRLVHDPEAPGHNALNQLGNRLDAEARDQLAARDAQWQERAGIVAKALTGMLERYVSLVNSGDAGHWDCETEPEVIAARAALSAITEE